MAGGITKLPDGRYEIRYRDGGRGSKQRRRRFRTKKLAQAALRTAEDRAERAQNGLALDTTPVTLSELADAFLAQYDGRPQSKTTLQFRFRPALSAFGDLQVRHLRADQIAKWYGSLSGYAPSTRRHFLKALRQLLDAAVAWHHRLDNPARSIRIAGRSEPPRIKPFESWPEVEKVADASGHYGPLIRFACATGLRPQEWAALQWRDVDLDARTLTIRRTIQAGKITDDVAKTRRSLRTVLLQRRALDALGDLPTPLRASQPVFTDTKGLQINPTSFRRNVFEDAVADADLDKRSPKDMRHTFATLALVAGVPLEWVSRQLGHGDIKTTLDYYVRWLPTMDERGLDTLDAAASASYVRHAEAADG